MPVRDSALPTARQRKAKAAQLTAARSDVAAKLRLIGDDTRMAILEELRYGECCVCDLADALGITQPLLSHHLRQLRDAGLLQDRKSGRWTYYSLIPGALEAVVASLAKFLPAGEENARRMRSA